MTIVFTIIHVIVSFILIMVVLLQSGKAADLAGAFGGGGSQTALGSRGAATLLTKVTTGSAVLFMFTSISLSILASRQSRSVLEDVPTAPISAPGSAEDQDLEGASGLPVETSEPADLEEGVAPNDSEGGDGATEESEPDF